MGPARAQPWTVRADGELYVRSAYGTGNPWFRRATASGTGRIRHAKYDRYGPQIVGTVTGPHAAPGTSRLVPQATAG